MLWVLVSVIFAILVYFGIYKPHRYWKNRNVNCSKPLIPFFGNFGAVIFRRRNLLEYTIQLYNEYPNDRYNGFYQFTTPMLLIRDLDLIKKVCVKDFDHFCDHTGFTNDQGDSVFTKSLIGLRGEKWREMRATLSPAFTSSKMRMMFNLMVESAESFTDHILQKKDKVIEMKDAFTRFTNDVIATTAFGLKCDSFKEPNNEFYLMGKKAMNMSGLLSLLKMAIVNMSPTLAKTLRIKLFPQSIEDFFKNLVKSNIQQREEKGIVRPDMIHLLMEARKGKLKHDEANTDDSTSGFATAKASDVDKSESLQMTKLSDDDITAQALLFFFAGFDTASTLSCFMSHELAVNPDIQIKLQNEIDDVIEKHGGKITYDALMHMKYLDQVVSESLRLWTPGFQTERMCVKDYIIEPTTPEEKSLLVEKKQTIVISVAGIHRNPEYYPNPLKFDPDRFSDENKDTIIPGSFMPFGVGPRNCIGSRFALLEVKVLFFQILASFDLVVVDKTCVPLKLSRKRLNLTTDQGFWLGLKPRRSTSL